MPEISIIIRTKNEERWISHSLSMLFNQDFKDFEVILVDNKSTDHTVEVAKRFPIKKIVNIENFSPGHAINEGIRVSSGNYIVCLSAHCVPKSTLWLTQLLSNFADNPKLAGVYGRQLPVSFTSAVDKRDLLIVFGLDRRIQIKDYFFHNANSMIRRDIWETLPFDENVTNIEDRVWGKAVIDARYQIIYDPLAEVYHHHGLHQGNNKERAEGVVSVIQNVEKGWINELPFSLKPEQINIVAILPIVGYIEINSPEHQLLLKTINEIRESEFLKRIYILSYQNEIFDNEIHWINRDLILDADKMGIDQIMQCALNLIELQGDYPESLIYVNYDYLSRPQKLFDELIYDAQYKGCDTVFPGFPEYSHLWVKKDNEGFKQIDESLKPRELREPVYRALYGLGCLISSSIIRAGKFIGNNVGIIPIDDIKYTIRARSKKEFP